jgi:hypothetical protein
VAALERPRRPVAAALVAGLAATLTALSAAPSSAELVGQFDARLKDVRLSYGAYTVVAGARVYDDQGAAPPQLTRASVRFPRGAALRREFLRPRFFCDPALLERRPDPALCAHARFATGRIVLDARPEVFESLPANVHLFLGGGRTGGAVASVVVLVIPNEQTPVYAYQVLHGRLFNEPEGRFGYRLELPTAIKPVLSTVTLSLAEIKLTIHGLRIQRRVRVCARRGARGRCLRRATRVRRVFWTRLPDCPRSRRVAFGAYYAFKGARPISRTSSVSCTRFVRRPSIKRKGGIPGA